MKGIKVNLILLMIAALSCGILSSCGGSKEEEKEKKETTGKDGKPIIEWVSISGGTFTMGSPEGESGRKADEILHQVTLNPFKISKYEVTVAQFKAFVDATGYQSLAEKGTDGFKGSTLWTGSKFEKKDGINWRHDANGNLLADTNYNQPVTNIAWDDAYAFSKWMGCRLPTEAEWEYACRAGTSSTFSFGNCINSDQANYCATYPGGKCPKSKYREQTIKVGTLPPNGWGLCDMHGNVAEWVYDVYGPYSTVAQTNPFGPDQGSNRVMRGGSWRDNGVTCRSASRTSIFHARSLGFAGFRLVLTK